jgi:prolyl-tRNA synthetase
VLFALRGSDELQETKACNAAHANELVEVDEEELKKVGLIAGYMGPTKVPDDIEVIMDSALREGRSLICGANEEAYHLVGNSFIGVEANYQDIVAVQEGDSCHFCSGKLTYTKGIEAGHIFQLGTQYSEPLEANFLDENGKSQPMIMGTYGIGVSRLLAAIIEQNHDDKGCIWTKESAPFTLHILISNIKDEAQVALGEKLYTLMQEHQVETLLDDRKDRFGAKIKDYELIGIPYAVVIGKKLADGLVEIITRDGMQKEEILAEKISDILLERF